MSRRPRQLIRAQIVWVATFVLAFQAAGPAYAHSERPTESPPRPGSTPSAS